MHHNISQTYGLIKGSACVVIGVACCTSYVSIGLPQDMTMASLGTGDPKESKRQHQRQMSQSFWNNIRGDITIPSVFYSWTPEGGGLIGANLAAAPNIGLYMVPELNMDKFHHPSFYLFIYSINIYWIATKKQSLCLFLRLQCLIKKNDHWKSV